MRPSRRASAMAAQTLTTTVTPGPQCAHCTRHLLHDIAYIECAFSQCNRLPLCIDCFVVGACAVAPHNTNHPYRVIEKLEAHVYTPDWTAQEETRLIQACLNYGLNQWKRVADYVCTKTPYKCEMHYNEIYLHSNTAPLPSDEALAAPPEAEEEFRAVHFGPASPAIQGGLGVGPLTPATVTPKGKPKGKGRGRPKGKQKSTPKGKRIVPAESDPAASTDSVTPQTPARPQSSQKDGRSLLKRNDTLDERTKPAEGALQGYSWQRQDFDVEFDDEAEHLIADLAIADDDEDEVVILKTRLLEVYDRRLQVREAVKKIIFDRNLLDFSSLKSGDRRDTRDEKELGARLQAFRRILDPYKFLAFYESVMFEYRLAKDMYLHAMGKANGLRTKAEIDIYEIDARRRAAELGSIDRKERESAEKKGQGRTKAALFPSPALFLEGAVPGLVTRPNGPLSTPSTPGIAANANGTPPLPIENGSPIGVAASPYATPNSPKESKTARLRRTREAKVLARSKYPNVSAMRVDREDGVSALTEPEKTLCSALNLLPMAFLKQRDAMLRLSEHLLAAKEHPEQDMSASTDNPSIALRAGSLTSHVSRNGRSSVETLAITSVPVTAGLTVTTRVTQTAPREDHIISGSRHHVRLLNVTQNSEKIGRMCHAMLPIDSTIAQVQIERTQAMNEDIQMQLTYCGAPEFNREERRQEPEGHQKEPIFLSQSKQEIKFGPIHQRSTTVKLLLKPPRSENPTARKLDLDRCADSDMFLSEQDQRRTEHVINGNSGPVPVMSEGSRADLSIPIGTPSRKRGRKPKNFSSLNQRRSSRRLAEEECAARKETIDVQVIVTTDSKSSPAKGTKQPTRSTGKGLHEEDERQQHCDRPQPVSAVRGEAKKATKKGSLTEYGDLSTKGTHDLAKECDNDVVNVSEVKVTEEILDGGDGHHMSERGSEDKTSAVEVIEITSTSGDSEVVVTPRRGRPRKSMGRRRGQGRKVGSPVGRSNSQRVAVKVHKRSIGSGSEEKRPERLRLRLNMAPSEADSSEKSSVMSSPIIDNDDDKDYELEENSDDQDTPLGTPIRQEQMRRRSQVAVMEPTRKSSRLSERLYGAEKLVEKAKPIELATPSNSPVAQGKARVGPVQNASTGLSTPEQPVKRKRGRPRKYPIGESPSARAASGRKPPVTPYTGQKRGRSRLSDSGEDGVNKMRRLSASGYGLRRRR